MTFESTMRMIWVTPKFPLGTPDGARHATCSLVRQLTERQVQIDLICLVPEGEFADAALAQEQLGVRSCRILRRSGSKFWPLPNGSTPLTFRTFAAAAVRKVLQRELTSLLRSKELGQQTYVVMDGLHPFASLPPDLRMLSAQCDGLMYRAHNVETVLWEQCADRARTPWLRWFFRYQTRLVRTFEQQIVRQVDVIAPVSEEDDKKFEQLATRARVFVTRIGIDFHPNGVQPVDERSSFKLLFLGRMDWLPNRAGLRWFLDTVWQVLITSRPHARLKIAGTGDGRWLQNYARLPGLDILGPVERVEPLYQSAALCIAPLFQGSGTRVKIIESARYMRGVISTALGAEGSGLVPGISYLRAETASEWAAALTPLTMAECRRVGEEAFHSVQHRFDSGRIAGQLMKSLDTAGMRS